MNSPTEISASTQLLLDEIRKLFHKFDARWAEQDAARESIQSVPVLTQSTARGDVLVADNWGGFFHGGDDSDEQHYEAPIIVDNWGGLFEQPAHILKERDFEATEHIRIESCPISTKPDVIWKICDKFDSRFAKEDAAREFSWSVPVATQSAADGADVVADNWGGWFEEPALVVQEHDLSAAAALARLEFTGQIHVDSGLTFPNSVVSTCFLTAPHISDTEERDLSANAMLVGVDIQRLHCVHLGPVECTLRATPLGGYDSSLNGNPESSLAHVDAPLDRAVGRVGQALEAATALRADALGAAGGELLAWVVAAESAQATCSTVRLAGNRNFADILVSALWAGKMLRWNDDNHGLVPVSYVAKLELCNISTKLMGAANGFTSMLPRTLSSSTPTWMYAEVINSCDKRPWPPPSQAAVVSEQVHELAFRKCYNLSRKPPWPPPVHHYLRIVYAEILESWKHKMVITVWSLHVLIQEELQQQFDGEAVTDLFRCTTTIVLLLLELLKLKENWQCAVCLEPTHLGVTIDCFPDGCFIPILCCVVLAGCDYMSSDINVLVLSLIQEQKLRNHNGCSSHTNLIDDVSVGIAATFWLFPVVIRLPHWLCFHFLWKPPWRLPAWVAFVDDGLDDMVADDADADHEHAVIPAELTMKNAAARVTADVQLLFQCCPIPVAREMFLQPDCTAFGKHLFTQQPLLQVACPMASDRSCPVYFLRFTELFWFKVIWLLPAFVLSTYFVQLKRGGLSQFEFLLLSSIWPVKKKHQLLGSSDGDYPGDMLLKLPWPPPVPLHTGANLRVLTATSNGKPVEVVELIKTHMLLLHGSVGQPEQIQFGVPSVQLHQIYKANQT